MPNKPRPKPRSAGKAQPPRAEKSPEPKISKALDSLRRQIDALDQRLVAILNERSSLVVKVGKHKRDRGIPIYAPHREAQVLDNVLKSSKGPLAPRAIEGIYRELMSGSFALEQPIRVGILGPAGSFSHVAAVRHFGSSVEFDDLHQIAGVFTEVRRGHVDYGLVPIENSIGGGIVETLDAFRDVRGDLSIYAEVQLEVHHALLANCPPKSVRRIHSKPEVFDQCRQWLATQLPRAELVPAASSSRAVQTAAQECAAAIKVGSDPVSASIGSELAGQIYGVNTLFPRVEDNPDNVTRFFVLAGHKAKRSGDDKTSIMFSAADKPGALVSVLSAFHEAGLNLTHIDKRPSGRTNWSYTFFIDAQGHREDATLAAAVREAERHCQELHVLGSYPRSRRIL
jgi:chorismate mutase/prephenate dehydratase